MYRIHWLSQVLTRTLMQALKALREGVDLRGMFVWTLIDNFEWHEAYKQQFGLYACDIGTQELTRVPREKSVKMVQQINQLLPSIVADVKRDVDSLIDRIGMLGEPDEQTSPI